MEKERDSFKDVVMDLYNSGVIKFNKRTKEYYIDPLIEQQSFPRSLGFEDIGILQGKNICKSRLDTNIESEVFRGVKRPIPMLASNMPAVVNPNFCITLYKLGALGIMHRALSDENLEESIRIIAKECDIVCASIGIGDSQFELCGKLVRAGANVIFIDIAHGYSDFVIDLGKKIKKEFTDIKLVIGNTINVDMMREIYEFADALKVGIANGSVCETKNTAACNEKQFTSIYKFRELSKEFNVPIISDGGTRESSDFTKAIAAGANSIMAGNIFARCPESAAELVEVDGRMKKMYYGNASRFIQEKWRGGLKPGTCPEGKIKYLDIGEPVENLLIRYTGALRSGITYSGAKDIPGFQKMAKFTRI